MILDQILVGDQIIYVFVYQLVLQCTTSAQISDIGIDYKMRNISLNIFCEKYSQARRGCELDREVASCSGRGLYWYPMY